MIPNLTNLKFGLVPYARSLRPPGDRRRFVHYARARGLSFEIADPARSYDVVVLSARADLSVWSRYTKGKLVYELIDSSLATPRTNLRASLRGLARFATRQSRHLQLDYRRAIEGMCRRADAVVCTTDEQREDILPFCRNVHIILDAHNQLVRTIKDDYAAHHPFRLVWEGLPENVPSLRLLRPVLERLAGEHPLEMHVITDLEYQRLPGSPFRSRTSSLLQRTLPGALLHEWREEDCADIICSSDLALIPLSLQDPFAAGKPENKLLLFWRMGMPVVVSATPAYRRAMTAAGVPMACDDEDEWELVLRRCVTDETARREAGQRGLAFCRSHDGEQLFLEP